MIGLPAIYTAFLISSATIFLFGRKGLLTTIDRVTLIVSILGNIISVSFLVSTGGTTAVIISGLIVVVIIGIFWERIIGKKVMKKLGSPILIKNRVQYYLSREDLPFEEIVSMARKEIGFASVTHELVADYQWDVMRGAIVRGVKITIMVLRPNSQHITKLEHVFGTPLGSRIENTLEKIQKQRMQLPSNMRNRLVVRIHDYDIHQSIVLIDPEPETNSSLMKIEEYVRYKTPTSRLNKAIFKGDNQNYYSDYLLYYQQIEATAQRFAL